MISIDLVDRFRQCQDHFDHSAECVVWHFISSKKELDIFDRILAILYIKRSKMKQAFKACNLLDESI